MLGIDKAFSNIIILVLVNCTDCSAASMHSSNIAALLWRAKSCFIGGLSLLSCRWIDVVETTQLSLLNSTHLLVFGGTVEDARLSKSVLTLDRLLGCT